MHSEHCRLTQCYRLPSDWRRHPLPVVWSSCPTFRQGKTILRPVSLPEMGKHGESMGLRVRYTSAERSG
ncbi:hypothetical protein SCLCIDRAFT_678809 [Scleroderma citrinum Foug A]|uniref:Uncharacterized protein n=1 Tax=Scleroderma citrinum Foug A TaxID=1036808 RepID=A0A0C2ZR03_9AGAM|nr:hypothetical protein SCLCIDRAFT_678809 [Scleroderma citrinum Foug A]